MLPASIHPSEKIFHLLFFRSVEAVLKKLKFDPETAVA
jgi:hypothetical protein